MDQFQKLVKAVKKSDTRKIKEIINSQQVNVNQLQKKTGKGVLQMAMQQEDTETFDILLSYPGLDLEIMNKQGSFPIEVAILLNNLYFVKKILQKHINPRKKNAQRQTALQVAIKNQTSKQILNELNLFNFDINEKIEQYGCLLNLAIISNQSENFMFLLYRPTIKIAIRDSSDNTCLMLAVQHNKADLIQEIMKKIIEQDSVTDIQKQFFINAQNKQGNTALHIAAIKDLQSIKDFLIREGEKIGLDITLKNRKGKTVDDIITEKQQNRLLQKQAEIKKQLQKRYRNQQKKQQKNRLREQEQKRKLAEKQLKKMEEKMLQEAKLKQSQQTRKKTVWMLVIGVIVVLGIMYLAIINAIENQNFKKNINKI